MLLHCFDKVTVIGVLQGFAKWGMGHYYMLC